MAKAYQISNNIIFSVNDDGSISKFASISESGEIVKIGESTKKAQGDSVWGYWLVMLVLLVGCIILFCLYNNAESNYQWQQRETRTMENKYKESQGQVAAIKSEKDALWEGKRSAEEALSTLKEKVGNTYPLIVSDIYVGNMYQGGGMETNYGGTIYSRNSMYLVPKITYYGINIGSKTFYVKLYKPDGSLARGSSSPAGYSYSNSLYVSSGANNTYEFSGWGSPNKGHWKSGNYRFEIWYGNTCLKSKTFTIY